MKPKLKPTTIWIFGVNEDGTPRRDCYGQSVLNYAEKKDVDWYQEALLIDPSTHVAVEREDLAWLLDRLDIDVERLAKIDALLAQTTEEKDG